MYFFLSLKIQFIGAHMTVSSTDTNTKPIPIPVPALAIIPVGVSRAHLDLRAFDIPNKSGRIRTNLVVERDEN